MTGPIFRIYVEEVLAPTLGAGDVVVMDNLPAHKVTGVRAASAYEDSSRIVANLVL